MADAAALKDRFEKLVRLALNNPNDNEARSAALKAIQMLAEHKGQMRVQFVAAAVWPPPAAAYPPWSSPYSPIRPVYGPSDEELREAKRRTDEYLRQEQLRQDREQRRAADIERQRQERVKAAKSEQPRWTKFDSTCDRYWDDANQRWVTALSLRNIGGRGFEAEVAQEVSAHLTREAAQSATQSQGTQFTYDALRDEMGWFDSMFNKGGS